MSFVDPAEVMRGVVLLTAPHMDDGVLACGATLARLPDKTRIHVLYATDGSRSPAPTLPWQGGPGPEIVSVRQAEARAALSHLGVAAERIHFEGFPDGRLNRFESRLQAALERHLDRLRPDHLLVPFRYDRHPDHLALRRAALAARTAGGAPTTSVLEYFVYYRWRLLPGGDVRAYVRPDRLMLVDGREQAERKLGALNRFTSQTTRFYPWQDRAILTHELLEEVCGGPEYLVRADPPLAGAAILSRLRWWIPVAHRLEPMLKRRKDEAAAILRPGRGRRRDARSD